MLQSFHLIYLEIPVTIRQVLNGEGVLLNNGLYPSASVCTIAKYEQSPGSVIKRADRNFHVCGEAVSITDAPNHVPIGLMYDVVVKRKVEPGQMLAFDDIEIQESKAYRAWYDTLSYSR